MERLDREGKKIKMVFIEIIAQQKRKEAERSIQEAEVARVRKLFPHASQFPADSGRYEEVLNVKEMVPKTGIYEILEFDNSKGHRLTQLYEKRGGEIIYESLLTLKEVAV